MWLPLLTLNSCHFDNLAQCKQPTGLQSKDKDKEYILEDAEAQTSTDAKEEWTMERIFDVFLWKFNFRMRES